MPDGQSDPGGAVHKRLSKLLLGARVTADEQGTAALVEAARQALQVLVDEDVPAGFTVGPHPQTGYKLVSLGPGMGFRLDGLYIHVTVAGGKDFTVSATVSV